MNLGPFVGGMALGAILTGAILHAGPLNPPAGPVASTYKTLTEVEPRIAVNAANTPGDVDSLYKITQPGSYYLTGNITGVAGKHGIEIAAAGVTLDLNGFDLSGVPGSLHGIAAAGLSDINVRNGAVRAWGGIGVSAFCQNSAVTDVRAAGNGGVGIYVGSFCRVSGCAAGDNGAQGVQAGVNCVITGCTSKNNASYGIAAGFCCTITDCSARDNGSAGIVADYSSSVVGCSAYSNSGGISVNSGSAISRCTAGSNTNAGIATGPGCTITACSARGNDTGILAGDGTTVADCAANANSGLGISVTNSCAVTASAATANGTHGIQAGADCIIRSNLCNNNGAVVATSAGIFTTSSNNRVEGNNCSNNGRGLETGAASAGNLFTRNSTSSNLINYVFVANNRYGPIVDATGPTAAVSGNAAGSTLITTDPHANFRY